MNAYSNVFSTLYLDHPFLLQALAGLEIFSSGLNDSHPRLLKEYGEELATPFIRLFQLFFAANTSALLKVVHGLITMQEE